MDVGLGSNLGVEVGLGSRVQLAVSNGSIIGTSGQRLGSVSGVSSGDGGSTSITGGSVGRRGSGITVASVGGGGVAVAVSGVSSRCDNAGSSHGNKSKGGNKRLHCERYIGIATTERTQLAG